MGEDFVDERRAGFPVAGELLGGEEQAGGAVAQHIDVVDGLAPQLRHRHRFHLRRRRLPAAQQLAGVLARSASAAEILAEAAGLELHLGAALVALQHRAVVALDAETAALDVDAAAIGIVAADMQLALLVDEVAIHRGVAARAAVALPQLAGFRFFVRVFAYRLVAGNHIEGLLAALLGRQPVAGTAEEHPGAGGAQLHVAPACGAGDVRHGRFVAAHAAPFPARILRRLQLALEIPVELVQQLLPIQLPLRDFVEMLFHGGGEAVVQQFRKTFLQALGDDVPHLLGVEAPVLQPRVAAVLNGGDDRGVGGGAADAALFHFAHEAGLAVPRRRLGEMLAGFEFQQLEGVAGLQVRQDEIVVLLAGRGQHPGVAVELNNPALGGEFEFPGLAAAFCRRRRRHRSGKIARRRHLAGDEAPPNQIVQPLGIRLHGALQVSQRIVRQIDIRRADGLVRLLRARFGTEGIGRIRQIGRGELSGDVLAACLHRIRAEVGGIGAHVGDMARLVQALRQHHRLLHAEAEAGAGRLLQGGSDEGRRGAGAGRFVFALAHGVPRLLEGRGRRHRRRLDSRAERLAILFQHLESGGLPVFPAGALFLKRGMNLPKLFRNEGVNLPLPLDDQAHRHGLHPPRREAAGDLRPQQGGDHVAHHPVQKAPRLLGVDPVGIEAARCGECLAHGAAGDFVEHHPLVALGVAADGFLQMPGDGFAFAVQIGGEVDGVGARGELLQLAHHLLLAGQDFVARRPAALRIDAHAADDLLAVLLAAVGGFLLRVHFAGERRLLGPLGGIDGPAIAAGGRQVADMPDAGLDDIARAQVLVDGLGLRRGFDDDQGFARRVAHPACLCVYKNPPSYTKALNNSILELFRARKSGM